MLKKIIRNNRLNTLVFSSFLTVSIVTANPAFSEVVFPEYTGDKVVDLSGKFDNRYADSLRSEINQSEKEIRVVFLNTKDEINLSFYAPKLFKKWGMNENSILVVIDPYLNKTGYAMGQKVSEEMKKREKVKTNQKEKEITGPIDYDNLGTAILDKFSPEQIGEENANNFDNNIASDFGDKDKSGNKKIKKKKKNTPSINPLNILLPLLGISLVTGGAWYLYMKRKRLKELMEERADYLFDLNIQKQEIISLMEELHLDIEKMNLYRNLDNEIALDIERLEISREKAQLFIENTESELEGLEIDDFDSIKEMSLRGVTVKEDLVRTHNKSVSLRKSLEAVINRNAETVSYVKNDIEKCKTDIEEIKNKYSLTLNFSDDKIKRAESILRKVNKMFIEDDQLEAIKTIDKAYDVINKIKKDSELIPRLYKQLREIMPNIIENTLNSCISDLEVRNKTKKDINNLKSAALISLSNGDFENSEKIVKDIFDKINEIKNAAKSSQVK